MTSVEAFVDVVADVQCGVVNEPVRAYVGIIGVAVVVVD